MQCKKPRITGAGTDEPHGTRVEGWWDKGGRKHDDALNDGISPAKEVIFLRTARWSR
jgi:hypothetical protein